MSGSLTTHVLDISGGCPAQGVEIELFRLEAGKMRLLQSVVTNEDGRVGGAVLPSEEFVPGVYELLFHVGDYFRGKGMAMEEPAFLDQVPIRFGVSKHGSHYHVPLLIAPWGYNTYRGS